MSYDKRIPLYIDVGEKREPPKKSEKEKKPERGSINIELDSLKDFLIVSDDVSVKLS